MRSHRNTLLTLVAILSLSLMFIPVSKSSFAADNSKTSLADTHRTSTALRVLFIGNSYTYFNNLPRLIAALAESAHEAQPLESEMFTVGGASLKSHWENRKAVDRIKQGHWDYVVLQEQSTLGPAPLLNGIPQINAPETFYQYARLFDAEIKKAGAKTFFFLTWARRDSPQNQVLLNDAYSSITKELNAEIAPVGVAWATAFKQRPDLELNQIDNAHPSSAGSYLAACVFYASFYGKSPEGLTSRILGSPIDADGHPIDNRDGPLKPSAIEVELVSLSDTDAVFLQQVAWQALHQ